MFAGTVFKLRDMFGSNRELFLLGVVFFPLAPLVAHKRGMVGGVVAGMYVASLLVVGWINWSNGVDLAHVVAGMNFVSGVTFVAFNRPQWCADPCFVVAKLVNVVFIIFVHPFAFPVVWKLVATLECHCVDLGIGQMFDLPPAPSMSVVDVVIYVSVASILIGVVLNMYFSRLARSRSRVV